MTPDREELTKGEQQCRLPKVQTCLLPKGKATDLPFPLSIHGAWMFEQGIQEYARRTRRLHENGWEDTSHRLLRTETVMAEAEKLRSWAEQVDPGYMGLTIQGLNTLLAELAAERERLLALDDQEAVPPQGEQQCPVLSVMVCPFLPQGNATEFPFPLSIHGAWMLKAGIEDYVRFTRRMHEEGWEDACYCLLRTATARTEAEKLRAWAEQVDPENLEGTIQDIDALLAELAAEEKRFLALDAQEEAERQKGRPTDSRQDEEGSDAGHGPDAASDPHPPPSSGGLLP